MEHWFHNVEILLVAFSRWVLFICFVKKFQIWDIKGAQYWKWLHETNYNLGIRSFLRGAMSQGKFSKLGTRAQIFPEDS